MSVMSTRKAPPPPPPPCKSLKPSRVRVYHALYAYDAQRSDELSFVAGDLLFVREADCKGSWWTASCGGNAGKIPSNYVEEHAQPLTNPLHWVAARGNTAQLSQMLTHWLSFDTGGAAGCRDAVGNTPLHWAARGGHLDCVRLLLQHGAVDINAQNKMNEGALHVAACRGHLDVVRHLVAGGADRALLNSAGQRPAQLANDPACRALLSSSAAPRHHEQMYGVDDSDSD